MFHTGNSSSARGLYTPQFESDACGTGFIANLHGRKSYAIVQDALTMLANMEHRGATGREENSGDGAGILLQIPHDFFQLETLHHGFDLPAPGEYGAGMVFFPRDAALRQACRTLMNDLADALGFEVLGYRTVPTDNRALGETARSAEPLMEQIFVKPETILDRKTLERRLYVLRKFAHSSIYRAMPAVSEDFYIASLSGSTIVYKGQLTAGQLRGYFPDLANTHFKSAIAVIHARFSTNTIPKWRLAQPFRYIAHNGEINTIQGNVRWWEAREPLMKSPFFEADELEKLKPVCGKNLSDSAVFDNVLEFLHLAGRSLPHALMMMIPEAWQHDEQMDDDRRAFYEYHAQLMEPWDGPAAICFTDGVVVGATLDRNGLRPLRYCVLDDGRLMAASEAGALPVDEARVLAKGRLQAGKMLLADLDQQCIVADDDIKRIICSRFPYRDWLRENTVRLEDLAMPNKDGEGLPNTSLSSIQQQFGYTREDIEVILKPMATHGEEPLGSMAVDTPLAVLSKYPQHISLYFKQLFAQVTNPPIDPIRERAVMSLFSPLGGAKNPLDLYDEHPRNIHLDSPVLQNAELEALKNLRHEHFHAVSLPAFFSDDGQNGRLKAALDALIAMAEDKVRGGANLIILSDRNTGSGQAPIPSLLATGAVHQHLIRNGLRHATSILVETGDAREVHHLAVLLGFGANAVNPYLALNTLDNLAANAEQSAVWRKNYCKACDKGLLKILSKMGVSTLQSYIGGQQFEALGIGQEVMEFCFPGTVSRIGGLGFDDLAREALAWRRRSLDMVGDEDMLPHGGIYQWQQDGEAHLFDPATIHLLQHAVRTNDYQVYKKYARRVNSPKHQALTLRGLLGFRRGHPVPLKEVEPVENILRRFSSGAMSLGSLSDEAHRTLAIAMNRIGAKSNCGEGGEPEARYRMLPDGDSARSAIKQVASGRFGVTSAYLAHADELQIKMAQGAKPGEGGQLPGHKVDEFIAKVRHSTPGVALISPPPHHDIYSIEDLAQLIFDLKNANPKAKISVKLVAKAGVGIIAAGVVKAKADAILISGHDGGTGASPLGSIRHAGLPWELGLSETHQTLVRNGLRNRVRLQTDGQIRTGQDLAFATLLGADEWGVATAALVAEGCILMRKCHLNTCPVGIATQDPELRKYFTGKPEHLVNFFTFLAQELREIMAELGFRSVAEMVGRVEMLKEKDHLEGKARLLDLGPLLYKEEPPVDHLPWEAAKRHGSPGLLQGALDVQLIQRTRLALDQAAPFQSVFPVNNQRRSVGTMLSYEISRRWHSAGLPESCIGLHFHGSAGQSFAAFGAKGLEFLLEGEANDYFGKGLSGARLIVIPDRHARFEAAENVIIGNVALMGATSGEAYLSGQAGERFAVRNSGARAVVEGVGDHACEYMTGGIVVVLGATGRNFAAGMTGGEAYVFDPQGVFSKKYNPDNVDLEIPDEQDLSMLRLLIRKHFWYAGSGKAGQLLHNWPTERQYFVKVMPRDYKNALAKARSHTRQLITVR